jgi:hypothetical protein
MNELDMSRPGSELFPDAAQTATKYNSYQDVNVGHAVGDPLEMGVKSNPEVASQGQLSQKEMNFEALRGEVSKMKEEREYWKGQAEAYSRTPTPAAQQQDDPISKWDDSDWGDSGNVKQAFETMRNENQRLREEFRDQLAAVQTKSQHSDWNNLVTQHVPQLTSKNPIFAEMIKNSSNPYEAAYLLAELNSKTQQQTHHGQFPQNSDAQRAIANSQKPQTINSIGGQGSLSSADYYASMSDEDFMKIAGKNLANI